MPELSFAQVMSAITAKGFQPSQLSTIYLIVGGDDSLKRELTSKLLEIALDPGFSDFDSETIDLGPGFDAARRRNPTPRCAFKARRDWRRSCRRGAW